MGWKFDAQVLVAALLLGQFGIFYLSAYRCEYDSIHALRSPDSLTALVVSDVHLLGKRRRVWIERLWIDMQIASSLRAAVHVHRPDVVLVLGDQLDEGGYPTSDPDYESYVARFKTAFASTSSVETIYLIGNHDSAFGRFLTPAAIARHERAFGLSNYATTVKGHRIVCLNTMALDADVADVEVQAQASSFLETLARESTQGQRADQSTILLSHLPLFRKDDLACGAERVREEGHVTYEHPSFQYETHHHVLSDALSRDLLTKLEPDVVLSGHTHAWCAYEHPLQSSTGSTAKEFTVPAFSWGQRPDPSYALLHIAGRDAHVSRCALPREPLVFALYGGTLAVLVLRLLWRGIAMKSRSPSHLHDQGKKLK